MIFDHEFEQKWRGITALFHAESDTMNFAIDKLGK